MDEQAIYDEGQRCGQQPECLATECPYLPPIELHERNLWMRGFGAGRALLSDSDFGATKPPIQTPHAG